MTEENTTALTPYDKLKTKAFEPATLERFARSLGSQEQANNFMVSLLAVASDDKLLQKADPNSILQAAGKAAALNLPIEPSLGMAWVVPFWNKKANKYMAVFIPGYRGLVQLAHRTKAYTRLHTGVLYRGQVVKDDPITGEVKVTGDPVSTEWEDITHFTAYFRLSWGMEKTMVWTRGKLDDHAAQYSRSWGKDNSFWTKNQSSYEGMAQKTILTHLLKLYGYMVKGDSSTEQDPLSYALAHDEDTVIEVEATDVDPAADTPADEVVTGEVSEVVAPPGPPEPEAPPVQGELVKVAESETLEKLYRAAKLLFKHSIRSTTVKEYVGGCLLQADGDEEQALAIAMKDLDEAAIEGV